MSAKNQTPEDVKKVLPNNVIIAILPSQESKQIGNLKTTPEMPKETKIVKTEAVKQMTFEEKMTAFDLLRKKTNNLATFKKTLEHLQEFRIEDDSNNSYASLIIRDSNRKEFTTGNAHAIVEVIAFLLDILVEKISQTRKEIAAFELPKV